QLVDRIDVRLGDGLSVIQPEDVIDNITICGMGGPLIAKILKDGQDKLSQHPRLILQSNIQTENLRQTLQQLNYEIIDEIIMVEKGHIYEIVVAEYST
ncbi:tRNA (adenine(22)-N(1))-methyltransferase TrmK, partial [Staphylococcus aureus]